MAAGAQLTLTGYPGAAGYAAAHGAIVERRLDDAVKALDAVLTTPEVSPLLVAEASYVLAMVLAAQAKQSLAKVASLSPQMRKAVRAQLARAADLAPSLGPHLKELGAALGKDGVEQPNQ